MANRVKLSGHPISASSVPGTHARRVLAEGAADSTNSHFKGTAMKLTYLVPAIVAVLLLERW